MTTPLERAVEPSTQPEQEGKEEKQESGSSMACSDSSHTPDTQGVAGAKTEHVSSLSDCEANKEDASRGDPLDESASLLLILLKNQPDSSLKRDIRLAARQDDRKDGDPGKNFFASKGPYTILTQLFKISQGAERVSTRSSRRKRGKLVEATSEGSESDGTTSPKSTFDESSDTKPRKVKQRRQAPSRRNDLREEPERHAIGVRDSEGKTVATDRVEVLGSMITPRAKKPPSFPSRSLQEIVNSLPGTPRLGAGAPRRLTFPEKLMEVLNHGDHAECICWLPDGEGFAFHPIRFAAEVIPLHFGGTKFESFTRKLNRWGFRRYCSLEAPQHTFVYAHRDFKRDFPEMCSKMTGTKTNRPPDEPHPQKIQPSRLMQLYPGAQRVLPGQSVQPHNLVDCTIVLNGAPVHAVRYVGHQNYQLVTHHPEEQGKLLLVSPHMNEVGMSEGVVLGTSMSGTSMSRPSGAMPGAFFAPTDTAQDGGAVQQLVPKRNLGRLHDKEVLPHKHETGEVHHLLTPQAGLVGATTPLQATIAINPVGIRAPNLTTVVQPSRMVMGQNQQGLLYRDLLAQRDAQSQKEQAHAPGGLADASKGVSQSLIGAASLPPAAAVLPRHQVLMGYPTTMGAVGPLAGLAGLQQAYANEVGGTTREMARRTTDRLMAVGSPALQQRPSLNTPHREDGTPDMKMLLARAQRDRIILAERELLQRALQQGAARDTEMHR